MKNKEPSSDTATRSQLLMSVTKREMSRGSYSPSSTNREIAFGSKSSAELNEMVSFHESHHAFLNASTTFGIAMVYCGALVEIDEKPFMALISDMIDRSIVTHETFATVRGLLTASYGDISAPLLKDFPSYQVYLDQFIDKFEPAVGIGLANMALSNAARIAMQTPIYEWLLETPCERWHDLPLESWNDPDQRFKALLERNVIRNAKEAMRQVLAQSDSPLKVFSEPDADFKAEWDALAKAAPDDFVPAELAAFEVFARSLQEAGHHPSGYDDQREQLAELTAKIQLALGPDSNKQFMTPKAGEDYEAVIGDFRREILSLRDVGLPLFVTDLEEQDPKVIEAFIHKGSQGNHLQFASMPLNKAANVFQIAENCAALRRLSDENISGFRRLAHAPEGGYRVEWLVVSDDQAQRLVEDIQDASIYKTVSLITTRDDVWLSDWQKPACFLKGYVGIVIDDDPIALMDILAVEGDLVHVVGYRMNMPVQDYGNIILDLIAFKATKEPERLYFTPCTSSLRTAILKLASDRGAPFKVERELPGTDQKFLADTLFNLLQEEGRFGAAFWI